MTITELTKMQKKHQGTVTPGRPFHLTEAHNINDGVWQGDLKLKIVDAVPKEYVKIDSPTDQDRQLVPLDGSPGSHHRLKNFDGVTLYRPKNWGRDEVDLRGPVVVFDKPNSIVHESGTKNPHGTVHIDSPMVIECSYQRNLDMEEAVERRARD